ncbi:bifunctional serine/threonine-protein kinase/ABC transporter substrate-binding protein [Streptomyces sodiiphilus]|uniref:bifunctional serine/threonine-protein kinase/ABC transporter substrate-binding protein n=1 Tax=Streptomyces sodiiphilus TaxID=226217 RepID=UPI003CD0BEA9
MEPLRDNDPSVLGGYRLMGRLGAGGMGVVYLGRTDAGELAAVKMVRAEYAGDEEFRARFRREADIARRVDSAWTVPVTGADTEGEQPWLATAFVAGPSLAEAVDRCGPLPEGAVRVLGRVLAGALAALHEAGLVHRDVKPGNILLGHDGPRLIDFGIARPSDAGATTLTAEGVVVGTPGYLPPEQAEGGTAGPAGDVFSLGCLLAYAATGRPPFGTGPADALLYRTVHDEPDLDGVPGGLAPLLRECLAKDPAARPEAAGLAGRLADDPRQADRLPEGDALAWLPDDVVRLIAARSAQSLDLPSVEPTRVDAPASGKTSRLPGRRGLLALAAGGAAVLAAGGGALTWNLLRDDDSRGAGAGAGSPGGLALGVLADLSGPDRAAGREQERGVRLAVARYNARADKPFEIAVRTEDDGGSSERAAEAAARLAEDDGVLAVLGPTGDDAALAALPVCEETVLPLVTASPGYTRLASDALGGGGSRALLRTGPSNLLLAWSLAVHLAEQAGSERPGLLQDRSLGFTGTEMTSVVSLVAQRNYGHTLYPRVVPPGVLETEGFAPVVADMLDAGIDSFVFAGPPEGAAAVARELAAAGFTGPRFAPQAALHPAFLEQAGDAAEGWQLTASFIDPASAPDAEDFAAAYREEYDAAPGYWAAEAYDAAALVLQEIAKAATAQGGPPGRSRLAGALREATYQGITREYAFDPETGDFEGQGSFLYEVRDGGFAFTGPA